MVDYQAWMGREEEHRGPLLPSIVEAMAAALDLEAPPRVGEPLPPGWQWLFFNPIVRRSGLGADGHPARGGFLPPIELPRRMWAGSRIQYLAALPVGAEAVRRSRIAKVEQKSGKRGSLCFVTIEHVTFCEGARCIIEEQDIVYRDPPAPGSAAVTGARHEDEAQWRQEIRPDTTLLFRYSALTFNGHRIHYDQAYAKNEEGYPDLVVHGPLTATLLQQFAIDNSGGRSLARFEFRSVAPLFVDRPFLLEGRVGRETGELVLWVRVPDGELAMSAAARLA